MSPVTATNARHLQLDLLVICTEFWTWLKGHGSRERALGLTRTGLYKGVIVMTFSEDTKTQKWIYLPLVYCFKIVLPNSGQMNWENKLHGFLVSTTSNNIENAVLC